ALFFFAHGSFEASERKRSLTNDSFRASLGNWITFIAIISPAWGASAHAIGKLLEYERIAMRSEQMARELKRITSLADDVQTQSELNSIVNQATRIINLENYEWWVLLSFNPPELAA
ncbi:MAG: hypothetical protein KZQ65_11970, partial [Candidatus Thiodiazotropha sp. (ex Gloverina cf. vestifex)]|nr:hypothetical protein [Candidatus Thiodiazotropha sp. (ex Gloverina cf. vestifex)]